MLNALSAQDPLCRGLSAWPQGDALASMSMARLSAATASRSAAAPLGADANMALSFRCWNLSFFSRICSGAQVTHSVDHCRLQGKQAQMLPSQAPKPVKSEQVNAYSEGG
jgi:Tfp pilus assembly protein PilV